MLCRASARARRSFTYTYTYRYTYTYTSRCRAGKRPLAGAVARMDEYVYVDEYVGDPGSMTPSRHGSPARDSGLVLAIQHSPGTVWVRTFTVPDS